jgi:hypothetical protein
MIEETRKCETKKQTSCSDSKFSSQKGDDEYFLCRFGIGVSELIPNAGFRLRI